MTKYSQWWVKYYEERQKDNAQPLPRGWVWFHEADEKLYLVAALYDHRGFMGTSARDDNPYEL